MNVYLVIILIIIIGEYILDVFVEFLNIKSASSILPEEFSGLYDAEKYKNSQDYLKVSTRFRLIKESVFKSFILIFIFTGVFNSIDRFARGINSTPIICGLLFAGILVFFFEILNIPFSIYGTFVIEERFGFNRTTAKTFILDILKSWGVTGLIGGLAFSITIWFFSSTDPGHFAWLYCWLVLTILQFFLVFIAPIVILPLFNKFIPLEEGELKTSINEFADSQNFALKGIFKMDASKRSAKSNAFFTGFGKFRRIVLFDTLIEKHSVNELVSILAHEIGHYKRNHIVKRLFISTFTTGGMFFILSLFINNPDLFAAFKMEHISVYAGLFFFGILYTPINILLAILGNILSRKYEYESDSFAVTTYKKPEDFILALKKLSVDNLSNLTPHSLKIFLHYSHPPVLERIKTIRNYQSTI